MLKWRPCLLLLILCLPATAQPVNTVQAVVAGRRYSVPRLLLPDQDDPAVRDAVLSYDDMFSAMETACFVDRAGAIRDRLTLGHPTEQGLITEVSVDGPAAVTFCFPTNRRHRLRVQRRTRLFGLVERWLILDRIPQ